MLAHFNKSWVLLTPHHETHFKSCWVGSYSSRGPFYFGSYSLTKANPGSYSFTRSISTNVVSYSSRGPFQQIFGSYNFSKHRKIAPVYDSNFSEMEKFCPSMEYRNKFFQLFKDGKFLPQYGIILMGRHEFPNSSAHTFGLVQKTTSNLELAFLHNFSKFTEKFAPVCCQFIMEILIINSLPGLLDFFGFSRHALGH
jgi:hypothetical protein